MIFLCWWILYTHLGWWLPFQSKYWQALTDSYWWRIVLVTGFFGDKLWIVWWSTTLGWIVQRWIVHASCVCVCVCMCLRACLCVCWCSIPVLVHCVDVDELSLSVDLTLPEEFDSAWATSHLESVLFCVSYCHVINWPVLCELFPCHKLTCFVWLISCDNTFLRSVLFCVSYFHVINWHVLWD